MKTTVESFAALQKFRPMFEALAFFMDDKESLASMAQAEGETEQRLIEKRKLEEEVDGRLIAVEAKERRAEELTESARKKVDQLHDQIQEDRKAILDAAREQAAKIVDKAASDLSKELMPLLKQRETLRDEVSGLMADSGNLFRRNKLLSIQGENLEAKLTKTRLAISELLTK